jgi:hypothetical protein
MNEFVLNGLVKRRASVTRAPKPRKINEQKTGLPESVWAPRIFVIPATLLQTLHRHPRRLKGSNPDPYPENR